MDSRGAPRLVEDPRGQCELLAEEAGIAIPHITRAREYTRTEIAARRDKLNNEELPEHVSVCVFGSWAREELTPGSDDDWAVLVAEPFAPDDEDVVRATAIAQRHLGIDEQAPGAQAVFGVPFDVRSLEREIGLDADTNTNLTRRILLLLESVALTGDVHEQGWTEVFNRYMTPYGVKDYHVPRFLLNDLVRYWRTICVDFEGKHRDTQGEDPKWVSRNVKLRTSRKLLFAGGLVPILLCELFTTDQMTPFLTQWFKAPPLDRIAAAFRWADAQPEGARALGAYDRWLEIQPERASQSRDQIAAAGHPHGLRAVHGAQGNRPTVRARAACAVVRVAARRPVSTVPGLLKPRPDFALTCRSLAPVEVLVVRSHVQIHL